MTWISIPAFANHIKKTPEYIRDLIKRGQIEPHSLKKKGKRYFVNLDSAIKDIKQNVRHRHQKPWTKPKQNKHTLKTKTKQKEKTQPEKKKVIRSRGESEKIKAYYEAELKKLKHQVDSGVYILASGVAKDADHVGRLIKERLSAIPTRIAPLIAVQNDPFECEQIIKTEINQILQEISKEVSG